MNKCRQNSLLSAMYIPWKAPDDLKSLPIPEWLDQELFVKGQTVFQENSLGILISNFRSLVVGLFIRHLCDPLILTQRSTSPKLAYKRYLKTVSYLLEWYDHRPWENTKFVDDVNKLHNDAAKEQRKSLVSERAAKIDEILQENQSDHQDYPFLDEAVLEDIKNLESKAWSLTEAISIYSEYEKNDVLFSQLDMAMVQISFFGILTSPKAYGGRFLSKKDMESFLHFWKVTGYYLGIPDEHNMARGTLAETKDRISTVIDVILIPSLKAMNPRSLAMAKILCKAYNVSLKMVLYAFLNALDIECPSIWKSFSFRDKLGFCLRKWFLEFLYPIPQVRRFINNRCRKLLDNMLQDSFDCPKKKV